MKWFCIMVSVLLLCIIAEEGIKSWTLVEMNKRGWCIQKEGNWIKCKEVDNGN